MLTEAVDGAGVRWERVPRTCTPSCGVDEEDAEKKKGNKFPKEKREDSRA